MQGRNPAKPRTGKAFGRAGQGGKPPLRSPSFRAVRSAQVAQSVEQRTENPRVGSSILSLGTI